MGFFLLLTFLLLFGAFLQGKEKPEAVIKIGVADEDASEYSKMLISFFQENPVFSSYVSLSTGSKEELQVSFLQGELSMYLVLPKDFAKNLINMKNTPIQAVIDTSDTTTALLFQNLLEAYGSYIEAVQTTCNTLYGAMQKAGMEEALIKEKNVEISYDLIFTALGKDLFFERIESERFTSISMLQYYSYAFLILLILFAGMFAGFQLLNEQRKGILSRLKITGYSIYKLIFQKFLCYSLIYSLVLVGLLLLLLLLFQISFPFSKLLVFLLAVAGSNLMFFFFSACFQNPSVYLLFGNMIILLFTILGGGILPFMYLPKAITKLSVFTPNYWFVRILLSLDNRSEFPFVWTLILLVIGLFLLFLFCSSLYQRKEGKRYEQI